MTVKIFKVLQVDKKMSFRMIYINFAPFKSFNVHAI